MSETTGPLWDEAAPPQEFVPLREDLQADVCVVGAGIAGMTTAYLLARAGKKVVVLEKQAVGAGNTGVTTAHLASALDDRYFNLEAYHGRDGARLAYQSHQTAIERIGQIAADEGIDCDFVRLDGLLFLGPNDTRETLERERDAAHRAGFTDVELLDRAPDAPFDTGPCLRFPRQGRFHPMKYLHGLSRAIHRDGGHIFTGTDVREVSGGAEASVRTRDGHTVRAGAVVVATNSPIIDRVVVHTKQVPYMTYAIGMRVTGTVPDHLYWDTADPYHYIRLQRVGEGEEARDVLIVGGEDHHTGEDYRAGERFDRLAAWTRERFPVDEVQFRWSGMVYEPVDYLAFIGRNPMDDDNVYIATGDSGHGMTHGTIAGMLISDQILGHENPWEGLYDPSRVSLRAAKEFVRANLKVARHYLEWVTGSEQEVASSEDVSPGSGAVVRRDGVAVAVYRDADGVAHEMSAMCTHLGCIVHWNNVESSWDCPCHGSRFAPTGEVINGPAPTPLRPAAEGKP